MNQDSLAKTEAKNWKTCFRFWDGKLFASSPPFPEQLIPIQPPIKCIRDSLFLWIKRPERKADYLSP
jgi:hypothetical protein